jgi:ABC-type multidrug transport system fused ATPase/permease subunit
MEVLRTAFQTSLVMEWAATAATALVAVQVSFRLVERDLAFGPALAVLVLTPEFFLPFRRLALEYHAGQTGTAAAERIEEALALPTTVAAVVDPPTGVAAARPGAAADARPGRALPVGDLALTDVTFTYPGAERPALDGVSLRAAAGETVALVGPSGAGKSTVARLVLRFAVADRGVVAAGGTPLADIDLRDWRRSVAWVPQDPTTFAGTVADNVRLAVPDADDDRVRSALRSAGAEGFVAALPHGLDTMLGEGGLRLSGGQRQRLAIARAVLVDAPYVLLDEFTAHLDPDTETDVLGAVARLLEHRTALVIAHRPATIAMADRVVRLDHGHVVAEAGR